MNTYLCNVSHQRSMCLNHEFDPGDYVFDLASVIRCKMKPLSKSLFHNVSVYGPNLLGKRNETIIPNTTNFLKNILS